MPELKDPNDTDLPFVNFSILCKIKVPQLVTEAAAENASDSFRLRWSLQRIGPTFTGAAKRSPNKKSSIKKEQLKRFNLDNLI